MNGTDLQSLIDLLNLRKKQDVERYCRTLVIRSEDFSDLILAGMAGLLEPYRHQRHHLDFVPADLTITEEDKGAIAGNGVGPLNERAKKFIRKIDQTFKTRRLLSVHLFYTPCHTQWHLFYLDQRDYSLSENHWEHGPHIHYSHDSFTREALSAVWEAVRSDKPKLPRSLHVRYDYHHNRQKTHRPGGIGWKPTKRT